MKERELGTLEQLQVTPLTRTQLIVGKILPFVLIGYVQLTLFPAFMLLLCIPVGIWLITMDRQARRPHRRLLRVPGSLQTTASIYEPSRNRQAPDSV